MNNENLFTSTCRCCAYFSPLGRRGGTCQQLGVQVRGRWKTCSLAAPAFASTGDPMDAQIVQLEHSLALNVNHPSNPSEVGLPALREPDRRKKATAA